MSNRLASFPFSGAPVLDRFGGIVPAQAELALPVGLGTYFLVTGSASIARIAFAAKPMPVFVRFIGAPTFVHSSKLIVYGGADWTATAGDSALLLPDGDGIWRVFPTVHGRLLDGGASAPGLSFALDPNTGLYRIGADNAGFACNGAKVLDISATGLGVTGTTLSGDGTVSLPGLGFTADTNTGLYRIGSDNAGFACNGAKVLDISPTGLGVTGILTASNTKAFSAHKNGTDQAGIATITDTKITFGTEVFDVGSHYDTGNSRWTPPAGKVKLHAQVYFSTGLTANTFCAVAIFKNGVIFRWGLAVTAAITGSQDVTCIDDANGTDYYEVYANVSTGSTATASGSIPHTYFMGWVL
jgi:hypothetical protein